jgi:enamine deaminase RidA (YjgF/YER057c/UK114 family)
VSFVSRLGANQEQDMAIKRIQVGPRMSQAVVHGDVVFVAGQVCRPESGATTETAQTQAILAQIDRLLAEAGTSKQHLLSANIWLKDIGTFNEMNEVWDKWVTPGSTPARATVEARLAMPHFLVEIAVIAAVGTAP